MSSMSHYYDNWVSELKLWSMKYKKVLSVARATVLRVSQVKLWSMKNKKKCCLWHELQCCECHTGGIVSCAPSHSPHCHGQAFCPRTRLQCQLRYTGSPHLCDTLVWYTGSPSTRSQFIPRGRCRCPRPQIVPRDQITGLALNGEKEKLTLEATLGQTDWISESLCRPLEWTRAEKCWKCW